MKKIVIISALILIAAGIFLFVCTWNRQGYCPFFPSVFKMAPAVREEKVEKSVQLLRFRHDSEALQNAEILLREDPEQVDALWVKAEVLRRRSEYTESEVLLRSVLKKDPQHSPSLISLAFIRIKDNRLDEALSLAKEVLKTAGSHKYDQALAYIIMSSVYGKKALDGWVVNKFRYAPKIKQYLFCASGIDSDLPEVKLGMATYYLLAPSILGGDFDKAMTGLTTLVQQAPEFASAHARLAQAYLENDEAQKADSHLKKALEIDPENEVAKEVMAKHSAS